MIFRSFSFSFLPTPVIVPPVPAPNTTISSWPVKQEKEKEEKTENIQGVSRRKEDQLVVRI